MIGVSPISMGCLGANDLSRTLRGPKMSQPGGKAKEGEKPSEKPKWD